MHDEGRFRHLEIKAVRKLANMLGVAELEGLKGTRLPGSGDLFQGIVMIPDLGGLIVWCTNESDELLMSPWLGVMRGILLEINRAGHTPRSMARVNARSLEERAALPELRDAVWSEYMSTETMCSLLDVDELTLHRFKWASERYGWLRCKELYGDASKEIIYRWSVLVDRVLCA